jgi:hypothetical protein
MTDHDRGAYTPQTDAPLAFDARLSHGGRPTQAPVTLIISAVVLAALVIAMVLFYRSGVRGSGQPPQVVGAPVGETKAPPPPSAQPETPGAGLQVYKSEATPPGEGKIAPAFVAPPEDSATRPVPTPAPAAAQPAAPTPAPAAAARLRATQAPAAPDQTAQATAPPVAAKLAVAKPAVAKPIKKPAIKPAAMSAAGRRNEVQIGAFSSPAIADKGWNDVAALLPGQMEGKTKAVEQTTKDGKIFYRTYVGGFGSKDDADAFCTSLRAAGKSCFVK